MPKSSIPVTKLLVMKNFNLFLALFFSSVVAFAQKPPIKFGKVSKDELKMEQYDKDPDADAVVLCDYGTADIEYDKMNSSWKVSYFRICRIKIFNTNGFKWATEVVPLYDYNGTNENLSRLKGYTYNLEKGKIVKTKLSKDNVFDEEYSKHYDAKKFTLPNVKEGSVIEYKYNIYSDVWFNLKKWEFQKAIPVKWSEYQVNIPEYLHFLHLTQGFESFEINEEKEMNKILASSIHYVDHKYHWAAKDLPGLKEEKLITSPNNFYLQIDFQLAGYKDTYGAYHDYLGTWSKVNKELLEDEDFGRNLKTRGFYSDVIDNIKSKYEKPEEIAYAIYRHISEHMKWNGTRSKFSDTNIKKSYNEKTGNSAAINFLLISMLKSAGIPAKPVITSTVDHGYINPVYPILDKYNYLLAEANINGKLILMDATEKNLPLGVLPYRALNKMGRRIEEGMGNWVNITPNKGADVTFYAVLDLNENGSLSGNVELKKDGYSAIEARNKVLLDGEDKYLKDFKEEQTDWEITEYEMENEADIFKDLKEKFNLKLSKPVTKAGDILYVNPIISQQFDENPLKQENRKLPVELIYPHSYNYIMVINIPEGYVVDEMPQTARFRLPDNAGYFSYNVNQTQNRIQIMSKLNITKTTFASNEYPYLKEFFNQIFAKHSEQLVLKKESISDAGDTKLSDETDNE